MNRPVATRESGDPRGRSLPEAGFGPRLLGDGRTRFRLWAPDVAQVSLEREGHPPQPMQAAGGGWYETVAAAPPGTAYRFRVREDLAVPDPASRLQRDGDVHGWSVVTDPDGYAWRHPQWRGRPWREAVLYELHVGACGGYAGVRAMLPRLRELGITAIELMPVAQFPGRHNWGYDGVLPYAPATAYGTPDELKALVDDAHGHGLMVLLDVVYNHFGPDGNYLGSYASPFFHAADTPWGTAVDVAHPTVGAFFIQNALYWLDQFRFDGLRLDAVHALHDPAWLLRFAREVRAATPGRQVHLVLENEANQAHLLGDDRFDAQWNDDFHNALHVLLTGERAGYYGAYADDPLGHLLRCLAEGFAWQGEPMRGIPRGEASTHLPPLRFVQFLQNHDQVGNRAHGDRLTTLVEPRLLNAAYALLLLAPATPLLFMGEEWASRRPFLFFTDHQDPELRRAVTEGRRREFAEFETFGAAAVPDPNDPATFARSRPDPAEADTAEGRARAALLRNLLAVRRELVSRLGHARTLEARRYGDRALLACWQVGSARLCIWSNLGGTEARVDALPTASARWLHGGLAEITALESGRLPPACTLVCLDTHPA